MILIYGHSGAKYETSENTLNSFQEYLKHSVCRCELDFRLYMDGELMVINYPNLKCTTDWRAKVVEYSAAELKKIDAPALG